MTTDSTETDIPRFEGWVSASQAATLLKISRQAVHQGIHKGQYETVRFLSPIYVIRKDEILSLMAARGIETDKDLLDD